MFFIHGSFLDIWYTLTGDYALHWEYDPRRRIIYRHDNAPHPRWRRVATFPKHFHDGSEHPTDCKESFLSDHSETALREFLEFVRAKLR